VDQLGNSCLRARALSLSLPLSLLLVCNALTMNRFTYGAGWFESAAGGGKLYQIFVEVMQVQ
jgi:hypothetical protein